MAMYSSVTETSFEGNGCYRDHTFCIRTRFLGGGFARRLDERRAGVILCSWYVVVYGYTPVEADEEMKYIPLKKKHENEIVAGQMRAAFWYCWTTIYISRPVRS